MTVVAAVARLLRALAAATAFLTRAPLVRRLMLDEDDLVRGTVAFPVVGALIGAVVGAIAVVQVELGVPALPAAVVAVAAEVVVTGALHIDGLGDSADGLAGRDPEHALAIMRDHAVGVYGTSAVALDLLVKAAAIASVPTSSVVVTLAAIHAVSRAAPLSLAAALRYAGSDGTGRIVVERTGWTRAVAATGVGASVAAVLVGPVAAAFVGCLLVVTVGVAFAARSRLGGVTGDVLGAAVELTTCSCLVVSLAWSS